MEWYKEPFVGINPKTGLPVKDWTKRLHQYFQVENIRKSYKINGNCSNCGVDFDKNNKNCVSCYNRHYGRKRIR